MFGNAPRLLFSDIAYDHFLFWRWQRPRPENYVYVVKAEGDSPVKVGKGDKDLSRLSAVQTGNPRRLKLLYLLVGELRLENHLHRRLGGESRLVGEWFDGPQVPEFLTFVEDLANRMKAAQAETPGTLPHWAHFIDDWDHYRVSRTARSSVPIRKSFVEPEPVSDEEMQKRRERAWLGYARN